MVGRIIFPQVTRPSSREGSEPRSPPPPYSTSTSSELPSLPQPLFSETMTTTVTTTMQTTQTTTHFFSLPLWRRRGGLPMSGSLTDDPSNARQHLNVAENGAFVRTSFYNLDKELPAVPTSENAGQPSDASPDGGRQQATPQTAYDVQSGNNGILRHSPSSETAPSMSQLSTSALARASLGLGLPHVMPQAAASTPISDTEIVRDQRARLRSRSAMLLSSDLRRSKSFVRVRSEYFPDVSEAEDRLRGPRRNTVVALDNGNAGYDGKEKNKAIEKDPREGQQQQPKTIPRRPSFWNRRRVQSMKAPPSPLFPTSENKSQSLAPALPTLQPVSPMFSDAELRSSPVQVAGPPSSPPPGKLRRRHSERGTSYSTSLKNSMDPALIPDPPPIPKRSPHRPTSPEISRPSQDSTRLMSQFSSPGSIRVPDISSFGSPSASRSHSPSLQGGRRPRSMTNPSNLLHRLSMGFFSPSLHPSPLSSPTVSTNVLNDKTLSSSPRTSDSIMRSSISKSTIEIPRPKEDEESPELFLARLEEAVSRAEIVNVLAGSGDSFYIHSLQLYMDRFDFTNDPLDISLRKMLMNVGLPKETQQIDRVMEAFATRYRSCNPGLFISNDHPYILAFSLIMLHTDAFNKSNKRKMSKADYIKNTKLVGVPTDVLDYFYDNIVFAPFIFIEDPVDVNGQRGFVHDGTGSPARVAPTLSGQGQSSFSVLGKSNKIDPYYLITKNLLRPLRVDIESYIPYRNPFSYQGTAGSWNEGELRRSFALAGVIEVDNAETKRMSTLPFLSLTTGGAPGSMMQGLPLPYVPESESILSNLSALKMTKVGRLNRKDDLLDGGKRATNRKWKECSVVLTGSQLLFFRDTSLALELIPQLRSAASQVLTSQTSLLNPEELLSVKDTIAVYDSSYLKHRNVLRLVLPTGRQVLLQAESEQECNEWIAHVNYASAFKTAGIRMRSLTSADKQTPGIELRGRARYSRLSGDSLDESDDNSMSSPVLKLEVPKPRVQSTSSPAEKTNGSQSRSRILRSKIKELEEKTESARSNMDAEMRVVRNLALLTPFQRTTRNRLQAAVVGLGKIIKQLRLDIVKTTCYRDVLSADLTSEERERRRYRRVDQHADDGQQGRSNPTELLVPRMKLSVHEDDGLHESSVGSVSDLTDLSSGRPESSICESFHSALDFNPDWQVSTRLSTGSVSGTTQQTNGSATTVLPTASAVDREVTHETSQAVSTSEQKDSIVGDSIKHSHNLNQDNTAQPEREGDGPVEEDVQAEEWHKTRAARRVSLVRVPHGLAVAARHDGRRTDIHADKAGPFATSGSEPANDTK